MHMHEPSSHQSAAHNTHTCIWMSHFLTNQLPTTHTHAYEWATFSPISCPQHTHAYAWATFSPISCPQHTQMHMHEPPSHQSPAHNTHACICMSHFLTNQPPQHTHMHMHELAFRQSVSIKSIHVNSTTHTGCTKKYPSTMKHYISLNFWSGEKS